MEKQLAQINLFEGGGGFRGPGKLGLSEAGPSEAGGILNQTISTTIGVLTIVAAIWFVFQFVTGALGIIGAGGDKAKIESARQKIVNSLIGLVVVIAAVFLIDLVGRLLGLDILNPAAILEK